MQTVYAVILTDHGVIDKDELRIFLTERDAIRNFREVADDIQFVESDSFVDMCDDTEQIWYVYSEHYSVILLEKEIE